MISYIGEESVSVKILSKYYNGKYFILLLMETMDTSFKEIGFKDQFTLFEL